MRKIRTTRTLALMSAVAIGVAACDEGTTAPEPETALPETALLSVAPAGGAVDVALDAPVVVTFDHAMDDHASDYAAVHEGDVTGPAVQGSWMMDGSGTVMRFTPAQGWKAGTEYTVHLGGGMTDSEGHVVDLESHGMGMGGMWASGSMMSGGMMGGQHPHDGEGWQHENGSYGMLFSFTSVGSAPASLLTIQPQGGATDVDPSEPIMLTFDHPMHDHATKYADVHEGDVNGPEVVGTWSRSTDSTRFTFTPDTALKPGTSYTVHLGGGMMGADSSHADFETHGMDMGGMWADSSMMSGGMHGGMNGHMEEGWQHENGSYGMIFTFTTAGTATSSLVGVEPQGGATDVDPTAPVVVTFDHAIDPVMTEYAALHEGDINGPEVAGTWSLSEDSTQLIFTQDGPLQAATEYTIHLGGGMTDAEGQHVDMGTNGTHMGGEWATDSMMTGGMHGGGMNGGQHGHMGDGWDHPENGSHGMVFTFTTAG